MVAIYAKQDGAYDTLGVWGHADSYDVLSTTLHTITIDNSTGAALSYPTTSLITIYATGVQAPNNGNYNVTNITGGGSATCVITITQSLATQTADGKAYEPLAYGVGDVMQFNSLSEDVNITNVPDGALLGDVLADGATISMALSTDYVHLDGTFGGTMVHNLIINGGLAVDYPVGEWAGDISQILQLNADFTNDNTAFECDDVINNGYDMDFGGGVITGDYTETISGGSFIVDSSNAYIQGNIVSYQCAFTNSANFQGSTITLLGGGTNSFNMTANDVTFNLYDTAVISELTSGADTINIYSTANPVLNSTNGQTLLSGTEVNLFVDTTIQHTSNTFGIDSVNFNFMKKGVDLEVLDSANYNWSGSISYIPTAGYEDAYNSAPKGNAVFHLSL